MNSNSISFYNDPTRLSDGLLHLPFTFTMFLLYLWMKFNRHRTMFVHFRPYEAMMIMSVAFAILLNIPQPSPITALFMIADLTSEMFNFYISPIFQFSYTFTNMIFLYRSSVRNYIVAAGYRIPCWLCCLLTMGITFCVETIVSVSGKFREHMVFQELMVLSSFLIPQTFLVFLNLLIWFIWWMKINNQQPLPPFKVAYVISAIVYVAVTTLYGVFRYTISFSLPQFRLEVFDFHHIYYIPHFWILAAVISSHPEVQRVFQKKKDQNAEVFQLAYISV